MLTGITDSAPDAAPQSFKIAYNIQVGAVLLMFGLGLVSAASLLIRLRRASGDERQQIKWFAFAGGILVIVVILASPLFHIGDRFQVLAFPLIPIASAVAILKYHLYDLDLVVKKTLVFALLGAFITLVYGVIVGGAGALVGSGSNTPLSFVAAAVLAIAFQPVRERARRVADRLVYGKRATPYEVLAEFSERVSDTYAADDVLPRMAEVMGGGTGADLATIWLRVGNELRAEASWPSDVRSGSMPMNGDDLPAFPDGDHAVEVRHRGELLGALSARMPPSDPMNPSKDKLMADLASQAGIVVRNVRLIAELRDSRQRLVAAQDEERRKLERNLHDGAQQQLVALAVKVNLVDRMVDTDRSKGHEMLADIKTELGEALEDLRDLARGIYPPLLADKGLAVALEAQARKSSVPVSVEADRIGRWPQDIEAAMYFCCLETLQNIAKYAEASAAIIRLTNGAGTLMFEVTDDGRGFDPASTGYGTGLQGMADRLDALGGSLEVRSAPGQGTTVVGRVPGLQTTHQG